MSEARDGVSERTPLLNQERTPSRALSSDYDTLLPHAERVVDSLLSPDNQFQDESRIQLEPACIESDTDVVILLYARYLLSTRPTVEDDGIAANVRAKLGRERAIRQLDAEVERRLDGVEDDDGVLTDLLWRRYRIEENVGLSALDILSKEKGPSVHLSHPLVVGFLEYLWAHGPPTLQHRGARRNLIEEVESWISPRRLHFLHLVSFSALWTLTIAISLDPAWARPQNQQTGGGSVGTRTRDMSWFILALGTALQMFQHSRLHPIRLIGTIPVFLVIGAMILRSEAAHAFLLLSIPALTILLISPTSPSIPFLSPSLLTTSTRLFDTLRNSLRGWTLIWPLILVFCFIFSWSMNGDIYRGFLVLMTGMEGDVPVEEGVAPFPTRVTVFATLIMLFVFAIMVINQRTSPSVSSTVEHDTRDANGVRIVRKAHQYWIIAIRQLIGDLGLRDAYSLDHVDTQEENGTGAIKTMRMGLEMPPSLPPPLNLTMLPLDIVCLLLRLVQRIIPPNRDRGVARYSDLTYRVRFSLVVLLVGPLCLPLLAIEKTVKSLSGYVR